MKIKLALWVLFFSGLSIANDGKQSARPFKFNFTTVSFLQWQQTVSDHKGEILIVDLWATWCSSCLQRFPHMVSMSHQYKNNKVKFVSLLLEDPEEPEAIENAKQFLIKQKADFKHYFMNENIMVSFEKLDLLGIPTVFIYNIEGQLAYRLTGDNPNKQFTETDIEMAINKLLR